MKKDKNFLSVIALIACFSVVAYLVASIEAVKALALSPLIIGIIIGMLYANTVGAKKEWMPGLKFCTKQILRFGIIL